MTYEQIVELVRKSLKKTAAKEIKEHIAVEFDIYGEGEGAFYVEISEGKLAVEPYEYYDRDAKIIVTAQELEKIIKGEKTPVESIEEGIMMVEGDAEAAAKMMSLAKASAKKAAEKKPAAKKTTVKKETDKKPAAKKTAKKAAKAEKKIVEMTKTPKNKVAKDIKR